MRDDQAVSGPDPFNGKRAVVTGAGSGIGRAIAAALTRRGCRVVVADIDEARTNAVARSLGENAVGITCDVARHEEVIALADAAEAAFGGVDFVFANAGVGLSVMVVDADPAALDWILGVNVRGTWNTVSVFAKRWRDTGATGALCITASEHALGMQHPGMGLYTATKHAVLGLADVMRAELPASIGVSVLCPGLVATDLHLAKRTSDLPLDPPAMLAFGAAVMAKGMAPEEIAEAALNGVIAGEFLIVTHASSRPAAERRSQIVADAFDRQAPWSEQAMDLDVNRVFAKVMAEMSETGR